jgi:hypothetical protein
MPNTIRIHVFMKDGQCQVFPPVATAKGDATQANADTIEVSNETGDAVVFMFPDDQVFHNQPAGQGLSHFHKIDRAGGPNPKHTIQAKAAPGAYIYAIFCKQTGSFATGGSDPEIIVD